MAITYTPPQSRASVPSQPFNAARLSTFDGMIATAAQPTQLRQGSLRIAAVFAVKGGTK